jgi:hypothetical protein
MDWALASPNFPNAWLLAVRFARGEIDETEYRHQLEVLRSAPHR